MLLANFEENGIGLIGDHGISRCFDTRRLRALYMTSGTSRLPRATILPSRSSEKSMNSDFSRGAHQSSLFSVGHAYLQRTHRSFG